MFAGPPIPESGIDAADIALPEVVAAPRLPDGTVKAAILWDTLQAASSRRLDDAEQLELVAGWQRLESAAAARRLAAAHAFHATPYRGSSGLREFAADEIAVRTASTKRAAERDLSLAYVVQRKLPLTRTALDCGAIDVRKASTIADACAILDPADARAVEAKVLETALTRNASALWQKLRRAVIQIAPAAAEVRRQRAHEERFVSSTPADDGMADLHAHVTNYDSVVINSALNAAARGMKAAGDSRTMDQLRADALAAPFLKALHTGVLDGLTPISLARHRGSLPRVEVCVPAATLLGRSEAPGELRGYGPISAEQAREIASDAEWIRILTDPVSGAAIDVGTTTYTPPATMARFVEQRDGTCRFPNCSTKATLCDLDHTDPFPRGNTSSGNLGSHCRRHHRFKHQGGGATVEQVRPGTFEWRMPTGQRHTVDPPRRTSANDPLIGKY